MKKINFKWLLLSFILSIASINTAWATTYAIAGAFNDWSTTKNQRTGTGTIDVAITSTGTYEFKIVVDGSHWCGNSGTMTRANCTNWGFTYDGGNNCKITVDVAGTYTFNITNSTPTLSVLYPCTVTYDGNGKTSGSVPTDASSPYKSGSTVTVKGNTGSLAKTGFHFAGWNSNADGTGTDYAASSTFSISSNTTLYAKWVKTIYVYDDASFSTLYLYTWGSTSLGDWPGKGTSTNYVNSLGSNWYEVNIPAGAGSFILNNYSDKQTNDLSNGTYTDGRSYHFVDGAYSKKDLEEKKLTVSFNMKDHGDAVSDQSVYYNGLVTEPDDPTADHYTFGGWYKETGCSNAWNFSTDRITAAKTLYAKWTEVTHDVNATYGTGCSSVSPSTWTAMGEVTGGAITATNATGYHFTGWTILDSKGGSFADASSASTTFYPVSNDTWVKANFAPNTYDITLDKNGGDSDGSATATYLDDDLASFSGASRTGYTCDGYFDDPDDGEGNMIIDASGNLQLNQTGYTNASGWSKTTTPTTLYAHWTENVSNYTVTYGVKSDQTSLGTLSCATTVGGTAISSGDEVAGGTGITFTAAPISGYEVDAWCSNTACTKPIAGAGYANTYALSLSQDTTVYVKFKKKMYTITYSPSSAPTGCTYTTKPTTGTYGNTVTMRFTPSTGYTVSVSARDASSNPVTISNPSANTYTFTQPASAVTVTVTATEVKSSITVTANDTTKGTLKFGETSKKWKNATASVGVATSQNVTATASSGYVFCNWVLSGHATSSSTLTNTTITLKADGTGSAGTATAMFYDDYYYRGDKNSWAGTSTDKLVPHTCGYYAYYKAATGAHNFKITPDASSYDYACNMFDNSYGDLTLTSVDDGFGGTNVRCAGDGGSGHFICMLYPNTAVNDLTTPIIFAIDGDDEGDLPNLAPETMYATTFSAGDHGVINVKGSEISTSASVNIGATLRPLIATPADGYSFDKWVTVGSVTVTDPYSDTTTVSASAAGGTVTATYLANSGWYAHGVIDSYGEWGTDKKARPIDRPYRGVSDVYYRRITKLDNNAYFGVHDGTNKYSGSTSGSSDTDVSLNSDITLYTNDTKSFQAKADFAGKWLVVNTNGTKKMWIQNSTTYNTVSISNDGNGTKGTVVLKTNDHGNLATNQYTNGETIRVEIDTMAHYSIASVTLSWGVSSSSTVTMSYSSGTKYTGTVVMPNSNATLTVTYTPWYQVKLAASPAAAADAPTAAKTTGGATVAHNSYVLSGTSVTFTKQSANGGYTWDHWENNGSGSETGNTYVATISATTTVTAVYTENDYTVTVQSSDATYGGTVASSSVDGHKTTKVTLPTATAKPGYYFVNWTTTAGTLTNETSASACQINGLTSTATVTANFNPIWTIAGLGGDWDANKLTLYTTYKESTVNYAFLDIDTLKPNTDYQFKAVQRSTGDYVWWTAEVAEKRNINYGNSNTRLDMVSGGTDNNFHMHTAGAGRYTFDINLDDDKHPIKVHYPTSYTVAFGYGTGGSEVTATVEDATTITTGQYAASGKDITFTQTPATGYTFKGWYDASSGGSAISCMSSDNVYDDIAGNIEVYAQYTANTYAVTFNATTNGGTLSGSSPKNVTYDATSLASCPVGQKNGYIFDGWYTAATSGKKVINPDGSFVANVTDGTQYTGAGGAWKKAAACTVYAVYVAPDTLLLQKPRVDGKRVPIDTLDAKNHPEIDSVIVHHHFAPSAPYGNYNITYKLCYSNHVQLDVQPTIHYGTGVGKVGHDTIWMPMDEIQMYELVAYLRTGSTRGEGDLVTTDTALVSVEKTWPVKVRYIMDGVDLRDATEWPVYPSVRTTEVRIPKENCGYELDHLDYGVGVTSDSAKYIYDGEVYATYVKAANAATITAYYRVPANTIYVKRLDANGWYFTSFYVYEYGPDGYWTTGKGSGSKSVAAATQSEHVYRVDDVSMHTISGSSSKMSLTDVPMDDTQDFGTFLYDPGYEIPPYMCTPDVIYRTDYNSALPMFVPVAKDYQDTYIMNQNAAKDTLARYYRGFWMRYSPDPDSTGYFLHVYDQKEVEGAKLIQSIPMRLTKTGADGTLELTATMDLEGGKTYGFKYTKATGASTVDWYGESGTMTSTNHTDWLFTTGTNNCGLTTTSAGDYTFHLHCVNYGAKDPNTASATDVQGKMVMTVDYATLNGDFRVVYQDDSQLDLTDGVGVEPIASQSMRARADGQDTVTFYIRKDATNRSMKFQKFNGSTGAWDDVDGGTIALTNTTGQTFTVTKDTTYQIYVQQNEDGTSIEATGMDYYSGSYYIRTDCVDEHKWDYKQSLEAHRMVESDYATHLTTDPFTHYYVSWVGANGNVKYVVATQYSPTLTDTLITDDYANVAGGNLPAKGANVRFMYNKKTNTIKRAYLAGAQGGEWFANFLKLSESNDPTGYMQNTDGDAITSITFTDLGNFAYQASIKAKPGLTGKLTAEYNSQTQYFKGGPSTSETILGGTGESWQNIIMTYDFKTNRLICAWTPGDTISSDLDINADVMIIRRGKNDAEQIIFKTNENKLTNVKYIYGVIQLDYSDLVGRMYSWDWWAYEHCMYYISFPFDVLVSDITGVGTIGQDWRIQRYNGALRAEKGWFEQDGVKTWWEDVHAGDTLHAYEGYSLLLARTRFNDSSNPIWENKTYGNSVYLFFPSLNATTGIIADGEVTFTVPAHECNIERPFLNPYGEYVSHRISDSHWNMLGMPLFENKTAFSIADGQSYETEYGYSKTLQYLYAWNSAGNTLGIQLTLDNTWEFKTMYSYMVQYTGEVTFKGSTVNKIVAAKREEEKKNYHVNLELSKDEQFIGRTYIELRENAVDSFLLNEDVYMVQNGVNADIYTVAGGCAAAANVLPIANQIVPVGLSVKQAGTYVFSMPSDFDGEVILVDKYAQTRTNLAMEDYETALPTGEITDRFEVEININKVATAIDGTNGDGSLKDGNAHKFIENGMMYILQNGALYDAQGKRVK